MVVRRPGRARGVPMFVFFSNRLGCLGSILVSVVLTLILIAIISALR